MYMVFDDKFSDLGRSLEPSALTQIMNMITEDVISFSGGLPHPDSFPVEEVREMMEYVLTNEPVTALQYGSPRGNEKLIAFLAARSKDKEMKVTEKNFLITSGSQQALDLLARVFLDPEDEVIVESPTYLGALGPFKNQKAQLTEVPMDDNGVIPEELEKILQARRTENKQVKFIYLIPTFQNPTGVTLSLERRQKICSLASKFDVLVIEDDPYGELRYAGEKVPPLKVFDKTGHVIYLSTFSKIFSPGARMGWVTAHESIISKLVYLKESVDLHSSTFVQSIVYEYCRKNLLDQHIKDILPIYSVRRKAMLNALETHFIKDVTWTEPEGGFFLWATLPDHIDTKDLLVEAAKNRVAYVPGYAFYPGGQGQNTMRLSFSGVDESQIDEGIKRLAAVVSKEISK